MDSFFESPIVRQTAIVACVILAAVVAYHFCHKVLALIVRKVTSSTKATWDDILLNDRVLSSACQIVPPVLIVVFLPLAFSGTPAYLHYILKLCHLYIVVASVRLVCIFIKSLYMLSMQNETLQNHPLKGLYQMLKLIAIIVGVIIGVSILIDKNPLFILSGLGASAAILMLVFKDTILGLVAGVQLSANDMLKPGDWIVAPKFGANGTVMDVTLTTVKVRNWDMTIITIPPYSLVSDSFQNWRGMQDSGGRRVMRSINIDMNTIKFCSSREIEEYKERGWIGADDDNGMPLVNLRVFRNYVERYLSKHPGVNTEMLFMVRQLQPTPEGLPLELYFFSAQKDWVIYERLQSEVFEHVLAILPQFGLRIFQSPAGSDITSVTASEGLFPDSVGEG